MDLAINNVKNLCNFVGKMFVCVCVCAWVSVYLEPLSHFLPFKMHLTNILPILIKMVDFKNLAWATSFATRASRKFIYMPDRASGKKSYCHTLSKYEKSKTTEQQMTVQNDKLTLFIPSSWEQADFPLFAHLLH